MAYNGKAFNSLDDDDPFSKLVQLTKKSEDSRAYLDKVFPRDKEQAPQPARRHRHTNSAAPPPQQQRAGETASCVRAEVVLRGGLHD